MDFQNLNIFPSAETFIDYLYSQSRSNRHPLRKSDRISEYDKFKRRCMYSI